MQQLFLKRVISNFELLMQLKVFKKKKQNDILLEHHKNRKLTMECPLVFVSESNNNVNWKCNILKLRVHMYNGFDVHIDQ